MSLVGLVVLVPTVGITVAQSNAQPVGVGPVPIQFHLRDNVDGWFDTNASVFGDKSLAAAVLPRVGPIGSIGLPGVPGLPSALPGIPSLPSGLPGIPNGLPGVPGLAGGTSGASGLSSALSSVSSIASALPASADAQKLAGLVASGTNALIGNLGVDVKQLLGLDKLQSNITTLFGTKDAKASRALSDIDLLSKQISAMPASAPIDLSQLPVGVDLQGLLDDLKKTTVAAPVTVNFDVAAPSSWGAHDVSALIWPEGAAGFPITQPAPFVGDRTYTLTEPGLYAFACKLHPYMLGAIVVDDPLSVGLSFGKKLQTTVRNLDVPSTADIIDQLVYTFFKITNPANWQTYSATQDTQWFPKFPVVPILKYDANGNPVLIPDLDAYFDQKFGLPKTLPKATNPSTPGVGEVWVDTQMEQWAGKDKYGSATRINTANWSVERKIGAPQIDMNNPHNMWTDKDLKYLYVNEWWHNVTDVFDRKTGQFIRQTTVGPDPSHVMSRPNTDQLMIDINGGNEVVELAPGATKVDKRITLKGADSHIAMPHGQWMTSDGKYGVTPDVGTNDAGIVNLDTGEVRFDHSGTLPLAVGITPTDSKYYMANFLSQDVTCGSLKEDVCHDSNGQLTHFTDINLWGDYDPKHFDPNGDANGPKGGLSIQNPVSPDGRAELVANVLGGTTVIDAHTDKVVKTLPCAPGCHGINFGAKKGGGYYAYEANKFTNAMFVYDLDPAGDGDLSKAALVGKIVLTPGPNTAMDGTITGLSGFGGQGVLPIPLVYNGWVQNPANAQFDLTCKQTHPVTFAVDCK